MQTNDSVAKFVALRAALNKEREQLQRRLQQIEAALGGAGAPAPGPVATPAAAPKRRGRKPGRPAAVAAPAAPAAPAPRRGRPPRVGNTMSIREAIAKVTAREPLGLSDLVNAVQGIGYKFESKNPRNSVGAYLYSKHGKKYFKRANGKFSPVK